MIEKKIYSPWAFTNNENKKGKMNYLIYKEKAKQFYNDNPTEI